MPLGDPGIRKSMQRALVNYKVNEAIDTTNQTFRLRYNFDDTNTPQPDSYSFSSAQVAAFYNSGVYGVSAFGSSGFPLESCLLYTSPSPRDGLLSRMPSSA